MEYIIDYLNNIGVVMLGFPDIMTFLIFILVVIGGIKLCIR